jgi:hypothetical protein
MKAYPAFRGNSEGHFRAAILQPGVSTRGGGASRRSGPRLRRSGPRASTCSSSALVRRCTAGVTSRLTLVPGSTTSLPHRCQGKAYSPSLQRQLVSEQRGDMISAFPACGQLLVRHRPPLTLLRSLSAHPTFSAYTERRAQSAAFQRGQQPCCSQTSPGSCRRDPPRECTAHQRRDSADAHGTCRC